MAIKKDINLETGVCVNNAYCRIENITIDKHNMNFNIRKYADKDKPFFDEQYLSCSYNIECENLFKQAYEYLKTLEEFKDAEDC